MNISSPPQTFASKDPRPASQPRTPRTDTNLSRWSSKGLFSFLTSKPCPAHAHSTEHEPSSSSTHQRAMGQPATLTETRTIIDTVSTSTSDGTQTDTHVIQTEVTTLSSYTLSEGSPSSAPLLSTGSSPRSHHETLPRASDASPRHRPYDGELTTPFATPLFRSSFQTLLSVFTSWFFGHYECTLITSLVMFTSILYWHRPLNGWRRNADMCAVLVCALYHIYKAFVHATPLVFSVYFAMFLVFVGVGWKARKHKAQGNFQRSAHLHMIGAHFFANACNAVFYAVSSAG